MGVNLKDIIQAKAIELKDMSNKKLGIDAYNWAYQFLSMIRLRTGEPLMDSKGRITSHLIGIFTRTTNLMREGIFPCYVWDGEPPEFKHRVIQERQERKKIAKEAMLKAKTDEERRKFAQQISILTEDMIKDANKLLDALGVSHFQAPSEGEAQISHMVKAGDLWACASQDWDATLFGSPRLIRNLSITGKRKLPRKQEFVFIYPELVDLKENLERLGITNDQLIIAAMLIGTDYCPGVKGYGPKKALALIQETKTLKKAIEKTGWDYDVAPEIIFEWFKKPKTTDNYNLEWKTPDREKIMKLLVDEHEFTQERVESQLKQLDTSKGKREQTGLSNFFK